jgi:putative membrane-bound dehydrogenase-like protein
MNPSLQRFACSVCLIPSLALAGEFKLGPHNFTVPEGFEVEIVAGPPLVNRPISADFDEQGRLYVTDSSGFSERADKQLELKPHRIVRLEDTDGDGKFDKSIVFADKMMFPEGALWHDGSLYVAAPPHIWKLTDTDGDGVADKREIWHDGKTLTGCANDLHGPFLGLDGWIYWAKGAFAEQTYELANGKTFKTRASHIFRKRPDGTGIEPVMTGGMDNPVDVAFLPNGERFFTTTFVHQPEAGKRDGLVHAIYGGVYGKVNDAASGHKRTGDLMPVMVQWGASAPCGLTRYGSRVFGADYQDNLFACLFNLHKVTRDVLIPNGASFRSEESDFFVSDNTDFHPTDVFEDADGSLLVLDTGGWYKVCCPTSQLHKPDVLGAIYRIRKKGAPKIEDPRGQKLQWATMTPENLVKLLADERPVVRNRAIHELGKKGTPAVPALAKTLKNAASVEARQNAVWALTRIEGEAARKVVRENLTAQQDPGIRQAVVHSISVWSDQAAVEALRSCWSLNLSNPQLRRAVAEALGRIGDKIAVPDLLAAAGSVHDDRVLEHSLIYALIEIGDAIGTAAGLGSDNAAVKHAALVALDQMDGVGMRAELVTPLLASKDPLLRQTAAWVVSHHPDWGSALVGYFRDRLAATSLSDNERTELQQQLAQFARDAAIQGFIAPLLNDAGTSIGVRQLLLTAMSQAAWRGVSPDLRAALRTCFSQNDDATLRSAIAAARAVSQVKTNAPDYSESLLHLARDPKRSADLRLEALGALPPGKPLDAGLFDFLRANLEPARPVLTRSSAAGVLAKAKLNGEQLLMLTESIKTAGPLEVTKLLAAYDKARDEELGLQLMAALKQSKGLSGLHPDVLRPRLTNFPATVQQRGAELLAMLNADAGTQKAHLEEVLASLKGGDVRRGQAIFNGQKAACFTCHMIGYLGGNLGPDLTRIGQVRNERDLLESIMYPSVGFVRSYEPIIIATRSGEDYNGVLRRDASDEVVLGTGANAEVRIARNDIVEMRPGTVSVMPAGLDEQLNRQELSDLVAFLKAAK